MFPEGLPRVFSAASRFMSFCFGHRRFVNDTRWHHPIHLHGHAFRVLTRNGHPTRAREWQVRVAWRPIGTLATRGPSRPAPA
jgi:hypothetical protein